MFEPYLTRWGLTPESQPRQSRGGWLLEVRRSETAAILKLATDAEERRGGALMAYYRGSGAAEVLEHEGDALLLVRARGRKSLTEMARSGRDDCATRVLCRTLERLHAPRAGRWPPDLTPLPAWFRSLWSAAGRHGGILAQAARTGRSLLNAPQNVGVLHGDLHHGNVLHDEDQGWVAIDPKALVGERGYDYANILCNPDGQVALAPGRLTRQADVIAEAASLNRQRLMMWVLAYAGLSAAWTLAEGRAPHAALQLARMAAAELGPEATA